MGITAAQVKELRERTGSGMMECKKMLVETGGDIDAAIEMMRKSGMAKADKKAGRVAAEGIIVFRASEDGKSGAIVEINSETDFVAKADGFINFADQVADTVVATKAADIDALLAGPMNGAEGTVNETRMALIAKIGENINVRRFANYNSDAGIVGGYLHGVRIGVIVELEGGNADLARDIAMHIAASKPLAISADDVSADVLQKEKDIFSAQAAESGKPAEIIEKMVEGRIRKYLAEITLEGQAFVKDPDTTVGKLLQKNNAKVVRFDRLEVGEGIEKVEEDFAAEVMAQVKGS